MAKQPWERRHHGGQELPDSVQDRPEQNAGYDAAVHGDEAAGMTSEVDLVPEEAGGDNEAVPPAPGTNAVTEIDDRAERDAVRTVPAARAPPLTSCRAEASGEGGSAACTPDSVAATAVFTERDERAAFHVAEPNPARMDADPPAAPGRLDNPVVGRAAGRSHGVDQRLPAAGGPESAGLVEAFTDHVGVPGPDESWRNPDWRRGFARDRRGRTPAG